VRGRALPWLSLVVVYLLWGSTFLGIRVAVATIPPLLMTGVRYLIAGVLLLAIRALVTRSVPWPRARELRAIALTAVLLVVLGNGLLCIAETRVESGTAALLAATVPIWMLIFDALRTRAMPSTGAAAGIALGGGGIALLVGRAAQPGALLYALMVLLGSIAWAIGSVYARGKQHHPLSASLEMTIGGLGCIVAGTFIGEWTHLQPGTIAPASLGGMLWLITAGAMAGYTAYAYAVRTLPTNVVATYAYVNPVVAVILGALLLHEPVSWRTLAGGAAVVASVATILTANRSARVQAQALPEEVVA
jgi:drug/metabolite transporter (DMT)-like permease